MKPGELDEDGRCMHDIEGPGACSICKEMVERPKAARDRAWRGEDAGVDFHVKGKVAQFFGKCAECTRTIEPGDLIYQSGAGWVGVCCYEDD